MAFHNSACYPAKDYFVNTRGPRVRNPADSISQPTQTIPTVSSRKLSSNASIWPRKPGVLESPMVGRGPRERFWDGWWLGGAMMVCNFVGRLKEIGGVAWTWKRSESGSNFSRSQLFGRVWKPASNEVWAVIKLGLLPWCIFVACWPLRTRRHCKVWKVPLSSLVFKAEDMVGFPLFFLPWPVPIDIKKTTLLSRLPLHMQCLLAQGWHRNWRSFGRVGNSKCHARYKFWDNSLAAIRWIRPAYWLASGAGDDSEKNLGWIRQMIPIPGRGGFLESSGIHPVGNPGSLTLLNKKGGDGETRSFQLCPPTVSLPVLADLMIPWMGFKRSYLKGDGNDEFVLEKMRVYDSEMSQPTWYI